MDEGYDSVAMAVLAAVNAFPGLDPGERFRFAGLGQEGGLALQTGSGPVILQGAPESGSGRTAPSGWKRWAAGWRDRASLWRAEITAWRHTRPSRATDGSRPYAGPVRPGRRTGNRTGRKHGSWR